MKHLFLLPAFLLLGHIIVFSQGCLPEGITFTTQEQIDNFQTDYPECTEIEGDVTILSDDIQNLVGLNSITKIYGSLTINLTSNLTIILSLNNLDSIGGYLNLVSTGITSLAGLEGINKLNGIILQNNDGLIDFTGLNNLTTIENDVVLNYNGGMKNFVGLENLESINGKLLSYYQNSLLTMDGLNNLKKIGEELEFIGNDSLNDLTALINLDTVGSEIHIIDNISLSNLTGLDSIHPNSITGLIITGNSELSECSIHSICEHLVAPTGTVEIHNNASNCNSKQEVENDCTLSVDENEVLIELIIFPNPATSFITIQIQEGIPVEQVIIYNHLGQKALESKPVNNTLDVSMLKAGIYFVEVATQDWRCRTKLIIKY